jgi:3-hydroxyisobutyrate dehydrogenase-like beta-hydroxyacid dehydrogenase
MKKLCNFFHSVLMQRFHTIIKDKKWIKSKDALYVANALVEKGLDSSLAAAVANHYAAMVREGYAEEDYVVTKLRLCLILILKSKISF